MMKIVQQNMLLVVRWFAISITMKTVTHAGRVAGPPFPRRQRLCWTFSL